MSREMKEGGVEVLLDSLCLLCSSNARPTKVRTYRKNSKNMASLYLSHIDINNIIIIEYNTLLTLLIDYFKVTNKRQ